MKPSQAIDSLLEKFTLANAAASARIGNYLDAESHLMAIMQGEKTHPHVLDLLARIKAQQGKLREAEKYWEQALKHDPMNETYIAGLQHIAGMQQPGIKVPWKFLEKAFPATFFLIGTLILWFLFNDLQSKIDSENIAMVNAQKQTQAQLSGLNQKQVEMAEKIEAILAKPAITVPVLQEKPDQTKLLPSVKIDLSGVAIVSKKNKTIISFNKGLFQKGSKFKTGAAKILTDLGKQLEPYKNQITLEVTGYADDLPMPPGEKYLDNTSLALSRAMVVAEHLRITTELAHVPFIVNGTDRSPYPNGSYTNRMRNRTVKICAVQKK